MSLYALHCYPMAMSSSLRLPLPTLPTPLPPLGWEEPPWAPTAYQRPVASRLGGMRAERVWPPEGEAG